jgi:sialidase-1
MKSKKRFIGMFTIVSVMILTGLSDKILAQTTQGNSPGVKKLRDIVIYKDTSFYAAFPSVIKNRNGEYLLAFRRAPERRALGEEGTNHTDPNSYLVMVHSADGEKWTREPELIYAHPFGGSQDPCLLILRDGTLLCTSYGWALVRPGRKPDPEKPCYEINDGFVFLGGYYVRSTDGGRTWQGPYYPPNIAPEIYYNLLGQPLPAYNRGALCEGKGGLIFWVVAASDSGSQNKSSTHLLISSDKALTWEYSCGVATDEKASFNETSIYETPKGDLVAFLRTANLDDQACIARSTDGGKSFTHWQKMGFQGHPLHALRLFDNRVLLTYGYRHPPYGIRARILNPECTDFETAPEIILRDDGGNGDLGYPWAVRLDDNCVLVTYYFNVNNGSRHIAGTILEIE